VASIFVGPNAAAPRGVDLAFDFDANLSTGEADFRHTWGPPTTLERDLLVLASSVFAVDRAVSRGEGDDYARRLRVSIPVVNAAILVPLVPQIQNILRRLSSDSWQLELRQVAGEPEQRAVRTRSRRGAGTTLLFSGGLDSLAAAIAYGRGRQPLQLVSHKTRNARTDAAQRSLAAQLAGAGIHAPHHQFFVSSTDRGLIGTTHDAENTQRTRSFLFLTLGALAARRANHRDILFLAENGQLAINLPLTRGRIGAFSTYTAHPDCLAAMGVVLSDALGKDVEIRNPFVYITKAAVVQRVVDAIPAAVPVATSCWRNARLAAQFTHCGECVPCLVRRIAIERVSGIDPTAYARDPWTLALASAGADEPGVRNTADLAKFAVMIGNMSNEDIMSEWPDLHSPAIQANRAIAMYRQFSVEALHVMARYPALAPLLQ
jgi:7-cyano-7-deazaguanine synthase in queuosine biosynthesis